MGGDKTARGSVTCFAKKEGKGKRGSTFKGGEKGND